MKAQKIRKIPVPYESLAKWDIVEIRCRHLREVFYAALCQNTNCNIESYGMTKPRNLILDTKPIFAARYINGLDPNKTVLVPIACSCQVRNRDVLLKYWSIFRKCTMQCLLFKHLFIFYIFFVIIAFTLK